MNEKIILTATGILMGAAGFLTTSGLGGPVFDYAMGLLGFNLEGKTRAGVSLAHRSNIAVPEAMRLPSAQELEGNMDLLPENIANLEKEDYYTRPSVKVDESALNFALSAKEIKIPDNGFKNGDVEAAIKSGQAIAGRQRRIQGPTPPTREIGHGISRH